MSFLLGELGFHHIQSSHSLRDVYLLFASRFIRLAAFGAVVPVLILFLTELRIDVTLAGAFLTSTLLGDVLLSLVVTYSADSLGRRNVLAVGAALMALSGLVFSLSSDYIVLLAAAVIGVISPSGGEVGPFSAVEVGMLSQLVEPEARVYVLMWYQVLGFLGTSAGSFLSGIIITSATNRGASLLEAYRMVFQLYCALGLIKIGLSLVMTIYSEVDHPPVVKPVAGTTETGADAERQPLLSSTAPATTTEELIKPPPAPLPLLRLTLLCVLFSWDAFASSLIPISFISYYFKDRFGASIESVTRTLGAGALIAGGSQLLAGSLARRIGIIGTMVGTHMPAQLLTISLAFAPTLSVALTLFLARACIASMDTSVRGAFLSAIIPKASRTRFLGIINVCKTLASAPGPSLSGVLASRGGLRWTFVITGGFKLMYDVALWIGFKTASLEH